MKCKKKPTIVEAWQCDAGEEMPRWLKEAVTLGRFKEHTGSAGYDLYTASGRKYAGFADYIVREESGELLVFTPSEFDELYEEIEG